MRYAFVLLLMPFYIWSQTSFQKGYLVACSKEENSLQEFIKNHNELLQQLRIHEIKTAFPWSKAFTDPVYYKTESASKIRRMVEIELDSTINLDFALRKLMQTGFFEYVEKWVIPELLYTPNDAYVNNQYYLSNIRAFQAWDIWKGDTNMVIGITDTGIDFNHPDLWSSVKYNYNDPIDGIDNDMDGFVDNFKGWDFGTNDNDPQYQTIGHGVHVSGIAAATADNMYGIAGVGFKCKILPIKIDNAYGGLSGAYAGVIYAAEHGAKVINCSWGSTYFTQFGQDIIDYVSETCGALVVAACGNTGSEINYYPASYRYVLSVAATDVNDKKWTNSSYSTNVDLTAPGHNVFSTWPGPGFVSSSGTSMAAPIVSAAAALVASYYPQLNMLQVAERLRTTADVIDTIAANSPYQGKLGKGRVNLFRALTDPFNKPSVRMVKYQLTDGNDNVYIMGDTIRLTLKITNYLAPTSSHFYTKISTSSSGIVFLDSLWETDSLETLESAMNDASPFLIKLNAISPNQQITLKIEFVDTFKQYHDVEYITFFVNPDYVNLNVNKILTTVTSRGNFAYNDFPSCLQGSGFIYDNSSILAQMIGIMMGTSTITISDNVYGVNGVNNDFSREIFAHYVSPPPLGDQYIETAYSDDLATNPNHVKVLQQVYAFGENPDKDYFITRYRMVNTGSTPLDGFYMGLFADWDINSAMNNKAVYDVSTKALIAFDIDSTFFIAMKLLDTGRTTYAYAADLDGFNSSIALTDGFTEVEKYNMLKSNRYAAGADVAGKDVACMVSSGPYHIEPGDTLNLSFLIAGGKNYSQLKNIITHASAKYLNPSFGNFELTPKALLIYPNPVINKRIYFSYPVRTFFKVEIYDMVGEKVNQWAWENDRIIHFFEVKPGVYVMNCYNAVEQHKIFFVVQ